MSWLSSGTSNKELIENLARNGLIKNEKVKEAMLRVDRAHFSPSNPYSDSPQRIGWEATISAPHMHSHACEEMSEYLKPGAKILDVGSGSGYLLAVLAHLVQPGGKVVGVEHIQGLVDQSIKNLKKDPIHAKMLEDGDIVVVKGDGRLGYEALAPYDAIHVGAAANSIHKPLVDQLAKPGRLFIPVESDYGSQHIWHVTKDKDGNVRQAQQYGVCYVKLTDNAYEGK